MLVYNGASKELFHQSLDIFQYSAGIEMTWITRGKLSGTFFQDDRFERILKKEDFCQMWCINIWVM